MVKYQKEQVRMFHCASCGMEEEEADGYEIGGEWFCQDCVVFCDGCCKHFPQCEIEVWVSNEAFCAECAYEYTFQCPDCEEYYLIGEAVGEQRICTYCVDLYYHWCEPCGGYHYNDNCVCSRCDCWIRDWVNEADYRPSFLMFHTLSPNGKGGEAIPEWDMSNRESKTLFLGVELEVNSASGREAIRDVLPRGEDFLYYKRDGSLDYGFEIVTHPFTYTWYRKYGHDFFASILADLRRHHWGTRGSGMHIHLSESAFSLTHLYRYLKFFYGNQEFIKTVSRRETEWELDDFATLRNDPKQDDLVRAVIRKKNKWHCRTRRYTAVNLESIDTVEVRVFASTLSREVFAGNLAFVQSVYDFTKISPVYGSTDRAKVEILTVPAYLNWIAPRLSQYPYLEATVPMEGV